VYIALSRTFAFLMCCIRQSIFLSFVFLSNLPGGSITGLAQDRITFNLKASHEFTGFGLQLWPQTDHRPERDALIRDLNVSWVRFSFTPEIPEDQLKVHMSVNEILNVITRNEAPQPFSFLADAATVVRFCPWQRRQGTYPCRTRSYSGFFELDCGPSALPQAIRDRSGSGRIDQ
jgi:hypothetical protein